MAKLGGEAHTGLVVMPDTFMVENYRQIISLAEQYRLPTIYPFQFFVTAGGLMSYGADVFDTWRGAAVYIDRILHGAKPSELPVQLPTKFALTLNLKAAKAAIQSGRGVRRSDFAGRETRKPASARADRIRTGH